MEDTTELRQSAPDGQTVAQLYIQAHVQPASRIKQGSHRGRRVDCKDVFSLEFQWSLTAPAQVRGLQMYCYGPALPLIFVNIYKISYSPVDLIGNVNTIEKLVLSGTGTGDLPILSPTR